MRKVFIPVLLTLISSAALSPVSTTSAAIYDRDTTWWSVEELLDFYPEVEAEKEAECGHDQDCRMEFDNHKTSRKHRVAHLISNTSMNFAMHPLSLRWQYPSFPTIDALISLNA